MTSPRLRPAFSAALSGRTSSISTPPVLPSTMLTPSSPPWPARMVSSRPRDCAKTDGANATARTASPASVAVTADIFSSFIRTPLSARSDEGPCRKVGYNSAQNRTLRVPLYGQDTKGERNKGADPRAHRAREGEVHAPAVHRHPGDHQERRDPRQAVRR